MAWQNGRIPLDELSRLTWPGQNRSGLRLTDAAARSMWRLSWRFYLRFGVALQITDAYRDYDTQVRLKKEKGSFAATPGKSNHGWGWACDMASLINQDTSAQHRWMEEEGPRSGWFNPPWAMDRIRSNGEYEPWHWEYEESQDIRRGQLDDSFPIRSGSTGYRVIEIQRRLGLVADGLHGPAGVEAVRLFQRTRRLTPDGIVGPTTWAALFEPSEEEQIMAVKDEIVAEVVAQLKAHIDAQPRPQQPAYVIPGTTALYIPVMSGGRYWLRPGQGDGFFPVTYKPTDSFWERPVVGDGEHGNAFRRLGTEEIYVLEDGRLKHLTPDAWKWLREVVRTTLVDLPADHPIWTLDKE